MGKSLSQTYSMFFWLQYENDFLKSMKVNLKRKKKKKKEALFNHYFQKSGLKYWTTDHGFRPTDGLERWMGSLLLFFLPAPPTPLFFSIYNCNSHLQLHKCKAGFSRICPHKITTLVITSLSKSKCSEQRLFLQPCYIRMPEDRMKGCIPVKHIFQNKKLFFFHIPWKSFISCPI